MKLSEIDPKERFTVRDFSKDEAARFQGPDGFFMFVRLEPDESAACFCGVPERVNGVQFVGNLTCGTFSRLSGEREVVPLGPALPPLAQRQS